MKLSIISEGGGMRGAYSLGVIDALYSDLGLKRADVVTGSSASIGTLAYYASGQFYPGFHIWPEELPNWRFLSWRNLFRAKPFLDIDFLVDDVFRDGKRPLDIESLLKSPIELIVPITNSDTGKTVYLTNKENFRGYDPWQVLKASMALPFAYGKNINLGENYYFDGGYSDPLPIDHASVRDTRKIIIINKNPSYCLEPTKEENLIIEMIKPFLRKGVYQQIKKNRAFYKKRLQEIKKLEEAGDIVVQPSSRFSRIDNSKENLKRCIEEGRRDALTNKKLIEFIENLKNSKEREFYFC